VGEIEERLNRPGREQQQAKQGSPESLSSHTGNARKSFDLYPKIQREHWK
jgi:hypothetical protein